MTQEYSIGVDLGGTNLRIGSYAPDLGLIETISTSTRLGAGRECVVRDLCEAVEELSNRGYGGRKRSGVAIGTPGPVELPDGILRNPPNLPGWDAFNLREAIESRLGFAVEIEGDANVAALAECAAGTGSTYKIDSLCMLTLGTGVGNGLVLSGRIWHGSAGMGGEAGHVMVEPSGGPPCGCGGSGCLEQYASATAMLRIARERMGTRAPATAHDVASSAREGNKDAITVFTQVGRALGIALTGLINTLNLPLYVVGGGASEAWDLFAPTMLDELHQRSYVYRLTEPTGPPDRVLERHKTYILPAQLGSQAGLLGACVLAFENGAHSTLRREPNVAA